MGRGGIRPRKRHRQRPGSTRPAGDFEMQHSPYTVEGELEGFARFGRGIAGHRGAKRWVAAFIAAAFVLPFVVGLISLLE